MKKIEKLLFAFPTPFKENITPSSNQYADYCNRTKIPEQSTRRTLPSSLFEGKLQTLKEIPENTFFGHNPKLSKASLNKTNENRQFVISLYLIVTHNYIKWKYFSTICYILRLYGGLKKRKYKNTYNMTLDELQNIYTENLKRMRLDKKLTQEKLSEKAGITQKFLSDIEIGRKWGSFETMLAIANALEIEPYELLLPRQKGLNYNTRRTKQLMAKLRGNLCELVDTVENFLEER